MKNSLFIMEQQSFSLQYWVPACFSLNIAICIASRLRQPSTIGEKETDLAKSIL